MKNILIGIALSILAAGSAYALENEWQAADTDGDGVLTRAEARAVAAQVMARIHAPHAAAKPDGAKPLAPPN